MVEASFAQKVTIINISSYRIFINCYSNDRICSCIFVLSDRSAKFYSYCLLHQFVIDMLTIGFLSNGEKRKICYIVNSLRKSQNLSFIHCSLSKCILQLRARWTPLIKHLWLNEHYIWELGTWAMLSLATSHLVWWLILVLHDFGKRDWTL